MGRTKALSIAATLPNISHMRRPNGRRLELDACAAFRHSMCEMLQMAGQTQNATADSLPSLGLCHYSRGGRLGTQRNTICGARRPLHSVRYRAYVVHDRRLLQGELLNNIWSFV